MTSTNNIICMVIGIIGLILLINATIICVIVQDKHGLKTKEVDCYDKNNNKIIGAKCEKITFDGEDRVTNILMVMVILGSVLLTSGLIFYEIPGRNF